MPRPLTEDELFRAHGVDPQQVRRALDERRDRVMARLRESTEEEPTLYRGRVRIPVEQEDPA